jgi:hypothetical protein
MHPVGLLVAADREIRVDGFAVLEVKLAPWLIPAPVRFLDGHPDTAAGIYGHDRRTLGPCSVRPPASTPTPRRASTRPGVVERVLQTVPSYPKMFVSEL